jgi:hypothetical protein
LDVFEKVEKIRPEIEGVETSLAAARERLVAEIRGTELSSRVRPRRPWLFVAGAAGALAAATTGVLVVGSLTTPKPSVVAHPTSTPTHSAPAVPSPTPGVSERPETAQGVFRAASVSAIHGGLQVQPGQYLRVAWTSDLLLLGDGSTISQPSHGVSYAMATHAWVIRTSGEFYVPADVNGEWYFTPSSTPVVTAEYGQDAAADVQLQQYLDRWSAAGDPGGFQAGGGALPEGDGTLRGEFLTSLPDDADGVLSWFRSRQGSTSENHHGAMVGWTLMTLLASNAGTGDVRAAMLQALGTLPGSSIVDSRGSLRTIAFDSTFGEPGQAIDVQRHQTITVDVSTGRVSGTSDSTNAGGSIVPDGVGDVRNDYAVELVDGLPG